ncbi:MAG: hypothetical protein R3Y54_08335 [Eubacteriales bacterium]
MNNQTTNDLSTNGKIALIYSMVYVLNRHVSLDEDIFQYKIVLKKCPGGYEHECIDWKSKYYKSHFLDIVSVVGKKEFDILFQNTINMYGRINSTDSIIIKEMVMNFMDKMDHSECICTIEVNIKYMICVMFYEPELLWILIKYQAEQNTAYNPYILEAIRSTSILFIQVLEINNKGNKLNSLQGIDKIKRGKEIFACVINDLDNMQWEDDCINRNKQYAQIALYKLVTYVEHNTFGHERILYTKMIGWKNWWKIKKIIN